MQNKLKVIFVGMPDMAIVCLSHLLEANFNIVGVVPPKKNHETYNYFKQFVLSHNLNLITFENSCNEEGCIDKIKKLNADIGVVCSYNYLLKKNFLESTKLGYINCHPSKLPNYRGPAPYFHIINNGEKTSAVTLHFMDETFDTGDIIYQKDFEIMPFDTMGTLFNRTNFMLSEALIETLNKIQNKENLKRFPQDKEGYYIDAPKIDGNFKIRFNNSAEKIESLIKACNPFYNAFCYFRGVNLKIIKARAIKKEHNLKLGQIALADKDNFIVATQNGYLAIEILQIGSWGIFNTFDFYCAFSPKTGEFLE